MHSSRGWLGRLDRPEIEVVAEGYRLSVAYVIMN